MAVNTPGASASTASPATTSAGAATGSAKTSGGTATSSSSTTASATRTSAYDTLPAGYSYAYLRSLKRFGPRWTVVLDPLTMCQEVAATQDPNCAGAPPYSDDYQILNLSTRTYTVPLAAGAVLKTIAAPGGPTDYQQLPLADKSWADGEMVVKYLTNAAGEVTSIREFWHP